MGRAKALMLALLGTSGVQYAGQPIGSISSAGQLTISGSPMKLGELPSWPIMVGDEISTAAEPAVVLLDDGSRVLMEKNSKLRLEMRARRVALVVMGGGITYTLSRNSSLAIYAGGNGVAARAGSTGRVLTGAQGRTERRPSSREDTRAEGQVPKVQQTVMSPSK